MKNCGGGHCRGDAYETFPIEFIALGRVKTERELLIFHLNFLRAEWRDFHSGCAQKFAGRHAMAAQGLEGAIGRAGGEIENGATFATGAGLWRHEVLIPTLRHFGRCARYE
jgi:hypothetical protein